MTRHRPLAAVLLAALLVSSGVTPGSVVRAVPPPLPSERTYQPGPAASSAPSGPERPTLKQMVGQKLVVAMAGRRPSGPLLRRIRRGEIGGVVLLARNIRTAGQVMRLTQELQRAASRSGRPPLLIAIDQEGGSVRRVSWAPPTRTVPEMGRIGSTAVAHAQGARTGAALKRLGINVDLAPVADIPRSAGSFMLQQGRTFSTDPALTARLANAFADGLSSRGVLPTMKHFPGIGLSTQNTDRFVSVIRASRVALRPDLRPYRRAIRRDVPLIMLSNATYTTYDRRNAAGWSRKIAVGLLRHELGFAGATITDSLNGTASARDSTVRRLAFRAARAGTDMLLVTGSERASAWLYERLLNDAQRGRIPRATLQASYGRILAVKERLEVSPLE